MQCRCADSRHLVPRCRSIHNANYVVNAINCKGEDRFAYEPLGCRALAWHGRWETSALPQSRTCARPSEMSAWCQKRTSNRLVDSFNRSRAHRGAAPIVGDGIVRGEVILDLIEGFLGLVAVIVFLACLGSIGDSPEALEKRERDH
jgi:hypothetical protein